MNSKVIGLIGAVACVVLTGCTSSNQGEVVAMSKTTLFDKIKGLLSSKQMKSSKIATELGVSKKEINQVLYAHNDVFVKDIFFNWKLKG